MTFVILDPAIFSLRVLAKSLKLRFSIQLLQKHCLLRLVINREIIDFKELVQRLVSIFLSRPVNELPRPLLIRRVKSNLPQR